MTIASRLKEERERLGLSQPKLGELVGVVKQTIIQWEKGTSAPDAVQLSVMAASGADIQYVLTGIRAGQSVLTMAQQAAGYSVEILSKKEHALVDNYRNSSDKGKEAIEKTGTAVEKQKGRKAG